VQHQNKHYQGNKLNEGAELFINLQDFVLPSWSKKKSYETDLPLCTHIFASQILTPSPSLKVSSLKIRPSPLLSLQGHNYPLSFAQQTSHSTLSETLLE
jgi:predicted benzoate:H+ symporter BenE